MAEYIEREAVESLIQQYADGDVKVEETFLLTDLIGDITDIPSADVQPVKRGKWDFQGYQLFKCTNCAKIYTQKQLEDIGENWTFPNFCPNCGADLREDL